MSQLSEELVLDALKADQSILDTGKRHRDARFYQRFQDRRRRRFIPHRIDDARMPGKRRNRRNERGNPSARLRGVTNVHVTMDAEVPQGRGIANNIAIPGRERNHRRVERQRRRRQIDRRGQSRGRPGSGRSEGRPDGCGRLRSKRSDDARSGVAISRRSLSGQLDPDRGPRHQR